MDEMSPVVLCMLSTLTKYYSGIPMHIVALIPRPFLQRAAVTITCKAGLWLGHVICAVNGGLPRGTAMSISARFGRPSRCIHLLVKETQNRVRDFYFLPFLPFFPPPPPPCGAFSTLICPAPPARFSVSPSLATAPPCVDSAARFLPFRPLGL